MHLFRGCQRLHKENTFPHIHDLRTTVKDPIITSTFDLVKLFGRISVTVEDILRTAISIPFVFYQFSQMFFALRTVVQEYQTVTDYVFQGLHFVHNYVHDCLIKSSA